MKRTIAFVMVLTMICCLGIPAFAEQPEQFISPTVAPRASHCILWATPDVQNGGCSLNIALADYGKSSVSMTLEMKTGNSWTEIASDSWSNESFKNKTFTISKSLGSGTYRCSYSVSAVVNGESDYRSGTKDFNL